MTLEIWHNPRCSKSRAALELLEGSGADLRVRRYLEDPPDEAELDRVLRLLGKEPRELCRLGEDVAKELGLADAHMSREEWVKTMVANPILIERPVVVADDGRAVVGRPPESVQSLL
jgi:arsenate reductase